MTSGDLRLLNLPVDRKLFVVVHEGFEHTQNEDQVLIIQSKWDGGAKAGSRLLMTEHHWHEIG